MSNKFRLFLITVGLLLIVGCGQPARSLAQLGAEDTATPTPTFTPVPTATATATPEPSPTPIPEPTATPSPTPIPTATSEPLAINSAPVDTGAPVPEILIASLAAMTALESYHFEMDARISMDMQGLAMEVPFSFEGDYQAPDRMRGKMNLSLGFLSMEMETITIGDKVYTTNLETGEWEEADGNTTVVPNPAEITGFSDEGAFDNAEVLGEATLDDGTRVVRIKASPPKELFGDEEGNITAELLIGKEDSLLREMIIEGELPLDESATSAFPGAGAPLGGEGMTGTANISMTARFSDYNKPINIEAPIP